MSKKVLIVDDEPHIRTLIEQSLDSLEELGVDVELACDGYQAVDSIVKQKPDLIILDLMLPKMDGYEVCKKIKTDPQLEEIHVILLTAKGQEQDKIKGKMVGANDYITKPFDPDPLLSNVKKVLELS